MVDNHLLQLNNAPMNRGDDSHGRPLGRAQARAMVVHLRCHLLLRNRKDVGNLFYLPRGSHELRRGLAMTASFPQTWVMVGVSYGGSPMMVKTPTVVWHKRQIIDAVMSKVELYSRIGEKLSWGDGMVIL
jgi:hypothetical protein